MHKINMFSVLIVAIMFQFLVFIIPGGSVLAEDTSSASATFYEKDGWSQCFDAAWPHHAWNNLDAIYFKDSIYRGWTCYPDAICGWPNTHMLIRYYSFKATDPPPESPALIELEQPYKNVNILNNAMRFAVYDGQLFIIYANYFVTEGTYHVFFTQSTDGGTWGDMTQDTGLSGTGQVQGLIAKVMNDKLYVFMQLQGQKDIYCVTYDGTSWSSPSQDQKIYSFNDNECILSGDVFLRSSDGEPCLFIVTNDDTNTNNLLVYDPADNKVYYNGEAIPIHLKNAAVLQGNITNSMPYNIGSIQIWGIEQNTNNLWHFQYIVNADGHSGIINAENQIKVTDILPKATASTHIASDTWNYMTACSIPIEVVDDDQNVSLQLYDWVWWWGSTTATAAYGRSLKYTADYLKNSVVGEATSSADPTDPNVVNGI
ncbi:MAG: hypothetical protein M0Z56_11405, partial [Desulfobacteraceae bacterium]|nr:hypothetical protein [Desulfobacteraceae bacterium]